MSIMNIYKDFMYQLRKLECEKPYLIIITEYPPKYLIGYIKMLLKVPFLEFKYNLYYGEIRNIIYSYISFYTICIGHACKKADDRKNTLQYDEMMKLYDNTVSLHENSHAEFLNEFQPIESPEEQEKFDEIISLYNTFKEKLLKFGQELKGLRKQDKIDEFAQDHFTIGVEQISKLCEFSHVYISRFLADQITKIRISLEDIVHRIRNNRTDFQKTYEEQLNSLYNELYELNKEKVQISRNLRQCSHEAAENLKNIATVKDKIRTFGNHRTFARLDNEMEYWTKRLTGFEEIASIITNIKTALEKTKVEQEKYGKYEPIDLPGLGKRSCWQILGENLSRTRKELEEKYTEACRPLITYFSCRGIDRILYSDNVGSYFIDEYGHQSYITHYGAKFFHVNCSGDFIENKENEKYYFDKNGRYILRDGQKLYQLAPCTSLNELTDCGLWHHIDPCTCKEYVCSSQLSRFKNCQIEIHDLTDIVLLPKTEIINIERKLESDAVKFLWDCYGWILPEILYEIGKARPKNPIHYFAHLLLHKSHSISENIMKERKKLAAKFRDDIFQQRKAELEAKARAWKGKQVKPGKDFDTSLEDGTYPTYQETQQFAADLAMYYD